MLSFDSKAARQAWTYAGVILILGTTYMIRKTLLVFAISLMFAYLLYPLVGAITGVYDGSPRYRPWSCRFYLSWGSWWASRG